jgi:hypothetical protein
MTSHRITLNFLLKTTLNPNKQLQSNKPLMGTQVTATPTRSQMMVIIGANTGRSK